MLVYSSFVLQMLLYRSGSFPTKCVFLTQGVHELPSNCSGCAASWPLLAAVDTEWPLKVLALMLDFHSHVPAVSLTKPHCIL